MLRDREIRIAGASTTDTITTGTPLRSGAPATACGQCPHAVWYQVQGDDTPSPYCRIMHAVMRDPIIRCDGTLIPPPPE